MAPTACSPFLPMLTGVGICSDPETLADLRGRCDRGWLMVKETLAPIDAAPAADLVEYASCSRYRCSKG